MISNSNLLSSSTSCLYHNGPAYITVGMEWNPAYICYCLLFQKKKKKLHYCHIFMSICFFTKSFYYIDIFIILLKTLKARNCQEKKTYVWLMICPVFFLLQLCVFFSVFFSEWMSLFARETTIELKNRYIIYIFFKRFLFEF